LAFFYGRRLLATVVESPHAPPRRKKNHRAALGFLSGWQLYERTILADYYGELAQGVTRAAQEHGCNLLWRAAPARPTSPPWRIPLFLSTPPMWIFCPSASETRMV